MTLIDITLRDIIMIGSLLVSVALAYGRLRSEIRHLEDTKAGRRELSLLSENVRATLTEIRTSLARLEEGLRGIRWQRERNNESS